MGRTAQMCAYVLAPDDKGVINNYSNILSDLGDDAESIELRKKSLEIDPSHLMHHAMIWRYMRGMGDYGAAIKYLTLMAKKFPEEPEIWQQLAFAQLEAGYYGPTFRT
jgi:tetratricopeptide (TPR) repeat protein